MRHDGPVRRIIIAAAAVVAAAALITWAVLASGGPGSKGSASVSSDDPRASASRTAIALITPGGTAAAQGTDAGTGTATGQSGGSTGAVCRTGDLSTGLRVTGTGRALIVWKNTGDGVCTITGNPVVAPLNPDGSRADLPVDWVDHPSPAHRVTLAPGGSAYAGVSFESLRGCEDFGGLAVVVPGETRQKNAMFTAAGGARTTVPVCDSGFKVGTADASSTAAAF